MKYIELQRSNYGDSKCYENRRQRSTTFMKQARANLIIFKGQSLRHGCVPSDTWPCLIVFILCLERVIKPIFIKAQNHVWWQELFKKVFLCFLKGTLHIVRFLSLLMRRGRLATLKFSPLYIRKLIFNFLSSTQVDQEWKNLVLRRQASSK